MILQNVWWFCSKSSDKLSNHLKNFSWMLELKRLMIFFKMCDDLLKMIRHTVWWSEKKNFSWTRYNQKGLCRLHKVKYVFFKTSLLSIILSIYSLMRQHYPNLPTKAVAAYCTGISAGCMQYWRIRRYTSTSCSHWCQILLAINPYNMQLSTWTLSLLKLQRFQPSISNVRNIYPKFNSFLYIF